MFDLIRKMFSPEPEYTITCKAEITRGKRGRWRWILRLPSPLIVAQSPVHGESSVFEAKQALVKLV